MVYTVERPWLANKQSVSCIPQGVYTLEKRVSPVVKRTSGGVYSQGWEVTDVPDRTFIMIHPGNTMDDLAGCIAVGDSMGYVGGKWAILNSRATFKDVMTELQKRASWQLDIRQRIVEYP
jgi:hypothetical protein